MSRWQIPDQPPRKRGRSRWRQPPVLLLVVGISLLVFGLLATFGPLAFDLGGTDSPPTDESPGDEPAGEPPGADAGDGASGAGENGDAGNDGIGETIGDVIPGDDDRESANDEENQEECFIE